MKTFHQRLSAAVCTAVATCALLAPSAHARLDASAAEVNTILGLAESTIIDMPLTGGAGEPLVAMIALEGEAGLMQLAPHSVRSDEYQVLVQQGDGTLHSIVAGPERTLRGEILGLPPNAVAGSRLEDGLHARILFTSGEEYWLEPLAGRVPGADADDYVLYRAADVISSGETCALDAEFRRHPGHGVVAPAGEGAADGGGLFVAELACDADYEYYLSYGSASNVESRINSVINSVNLQYERDVDITHVITTIIVRTSSNDPYSGSQADQLLFQFRDHWETSQSHIQRDMAQLFTGRDLAGGTIGIAWLSAVCTSFGYSVVQSDFTSSFSCVTDLSAHELGHNWGADHCSCTSYTMNPYITCANQFHPNLSIPEIINHRDSRSCLDVGGGGSFCGDGVCDPGEDPCNCPADCGTPPSTETDCSDGVDNDCDGLVDCDDPDCSGDPDCGSGGGSAIVDCITYDTRGGRNQDKHLDVEVMVVNDSGGAVSGAGVSLTLTRGGSTWQLSGSTGSDGTVSFTLTNAPSGCYTSDVTDVAASGLTFDGSEPLNGFNKGVDATPDADCRSGSDGCG